MERIEAANQCAKRIAVELVLLYPNCNIGVFVSALEVAFMDGALFQAARDLSSVTSLPDVGIATPEVK